MWVNSTRLTMTHVIQGVLFVCYRQHINDKVFGTNQQWDYCLWCPMSNSLTALRCDCTMAYVKWFWGTPHLVHWSTYQKVQVLHISYFSMCYLFWSNSILQFEKKITLIAIKEKTTCNFCFVDQCVLGVPQYQLTSIGDLLIYYINTFVRDQR